MTDERIEGKVGRVTGTVVPGRFGEVMLPIFGGVEAFYAKPYDGVETLAVGTNCVVVEYQPPRVVLVTAMPPTTHS